MAAGVSCSLGRLVMPATSCGKILARCYSAAASATPDRVALVTGSARGIGLAVAKELATKRRKTRVNHVVYLTTRDAGSVDQLTRKINIEMTGKIVGMEFLPLDVRDGDSVNNVMGLIAERHGKLDVLVNNAGKYFESSSDPAAHAQQVDETLGVNYWGLKRVCDAATPILSSTARIVNMSSQMSHLALIPGRRLRHRFASQKLDVEALDELMTEYQQHSQPERNEYREEGWPECSYIVSKIAVNAYTGLLQKQLEHQGLPDVVVNSIHPGSKHSKIIGDDHLTDADASSSVATCCYLSHPCAHPRGKFIWHDLQIVKWYKGDLTGASRRGVEWPSGHLIPDSYGPR